MTSALLTAAGIGFLLGLRHAFEPDHLAAVSTLATCQGVRLRDGARLGLTWGIGHTFTVGLVALAVVALGLSIPPSLSSAAELLVALLLVLLGLPVVLRYLRGRWHMHLHSHDGTAHLHLHSHAPPHGASHAHPHPVGDRRRALGLGAAHGLAGSAAIVVLLVAAAPTVVLRVAYFAAFGAGTMIGMATVSLALGLAVRMASRQGATLATMLHLGSAAASVGLGLMLGGRVVGGF